MLPFGFPLPLSPPAELPLQLSQWLLASLGVSTQIDYPERIPPTPALVVSNHRSFMDAPLLMRATQRSIHFACHPYMDAVPVLREVVQGFGGFPLVGAGSPHQCLFQAATDILCTDRSVGVFPEGGAPMVRYTDPKSLSPFQRGFAHLALRVPVPALTILPVAIAVQEESRELAVPFELLRWFDPNEPLFHQPGWHPAVFYRRVRLRIGQPVEITPELRSRYQGTDGKRLVRHMTEEIEQAIAQML